MHAADEGKSKAMIYRTRPEFVEAYLLINETAEAIAVWCGGAVGIGNERSLFIDIPVGEGMVIRALENMYVYRNQAGEFKIMPAREFAGKYELL